MNAVNTEYHPHPFWNFILGLLVDYGLSGGLIAWCARGEGVLNNISFHGALTFDPTINDLGILAGILVAITRTYIMIHNHRKNKRVPEE